jgi:hypothetical protein
MEQQVLALLLDASIQDQDVYEDNVIRNVLHQHVPDIVGITFPPLHTLLLVPNNNNNNNNHDRGGTSSTTTSTSHESRTHHHDHEKDRKNVQQHHQQQLNNTSMMAMIPHIHSVLNKLRQQQQQQQQQQQPHNGSSTRTSSRINNTSITDKMDSILDRLCLQEQMLLTLLDDIMTTTPQELSRSVDMKRRETLRSQNLCRNHDELLLSSDHMTSTSPLSQQQQQQQPQQQHESQLSSNINSNNNHRKTKRITMMDRQRQEQSIHAQNNEATQDRQERRHQLLQLRLERKQRKMERRKRLYFYQNNRTSQINHDDNEEVEAEFFTDLDVNGTTNHFSSTITSARAAVAAAATTTTTTTTASENDSNNNHSVDVLVHHSVSPSPTNDSCVSCPLCGDIVITVPTLAVAESTQVDRILSQHMDQCQRRSLRRSTMRKRQHNNNNNNNNNDSNNNNDNNNNNNSSNIVPITTSETKEEEIPATKKQYPTRKRARLSLDDAVPSDTELDSLDVATPPPPPPPPPSHNNTSLDDLQEWHYEDRVDDWIENGLMNMKIMKERDAQEVLPGDEDWDGGLWIPAWINDRLFPYQRDGVRWMWTLHQQGTGGIVGDAMGLGKVTNGQLSNHSSMFFLSPISHRKSTLLLILSFIRFYH